MYAALLGLSWPTRCCLRASSELISVHVVVVGVTDKAESALSLLSEGMLVLVFLWTIESLTGDVPSVGEAESVFVVLVAPDVYKCKREGGFDRLDPGSD